MAKNKRRKNIRNMIFYRVLPLLGVVFTLAVFYYINLNDGEIEKMLSLEKKIDTFNWVLSSGAQSIAGFVGLILAGYAFILGAMDNKSSKKDGLDEIFHNVKIKFYKNVIMLLIMAGLAISINLIGIILNGSRVLETISFLLFVLLFDLVTIVYGIYFVILIVNPDIVEKTAKEMYEKEYSDESETIDNQVFAKEFSDMEKKIREYFEEKNIKFEGLGIKFKDDFISFSQIMKILGQRKILKREDIFTLIEISRFRNLIRHGQIKMVPKKVFENLLKTKENIYSSLENNDKNI